MHYHASPPPRGRPHMSSKRYRWQKRWVLQPESAAATHTPTGLQVDFGTGGQARAVNSAAVLPALLAQHGPHNAPQMLARLQREAAQLWALRDSGEPAGGGHE